MNSSELLQFILNPEIQDAIVKADIITITIGGNDLLQANRRFLKTYNQHEFERALFIFSKNMNEILYRIKQIKRATFPQKPFTIQLIGLYNPYTNVNYSSIWVQKYNRILQSFQEDNIVYVDTYNIFHANNVNRLTINVHPNKYGHELIAYQLWNILNNYPH